MEQKEKENGRRLDEEWMEDCRRMLKNERRIAGEKEIGRRMRVQWKANGRRIEERSRENGTRM